MITVLVGNTDGKLTQTEWAHFSYAVNECIRKYSCEIHFYGAPPTTEPWQNAAWVFKPLNSECTESLRDELKAIRKTYNQDSIAWIEGETELLE